MNPTTVAPEINSYLTTLAERPQRTSLEALSAPMEKSLYGDDERRHASTLYLSDETVAS